MPGVRGRRWLVILAILAGLVGLYAAVGFLLVPRIVRPVPAPGPATAPAPATAAAAALQSQKRTAQHRLAHAGHTGEWGPVSPSRVLHLVLHPFSPATLRRAASLLPGGFGWMIAAWIPAYAGTAIIFSLYPVLFQHAFGIKPQTSSLSFALIVFLSLPLFIVAGRVSQRHGPRVVMAGGLGARVVLLTLLALLAAAGPVPPAVPLAAFGGIMFAWSFLSVASPGLTGELVPQAEGEAQGVLNAASGLAGFLGSVTGGLVASQAGYPAALGLGAAATAAGLLIFTAKLLRPRASQPAPSPAA